MLDKCKPPCSEKALCLSDLEKFLLFASIWTHDIGMIGKIANEYYEENKGSYSINNARNLHDKISAWHILKNYKQIFLRGENEISDPVEEERRNKMLESYVHVINLIIKYHRRSTDIEECPDVVYLGEEEIKCRLLACFLRLGDTLNIDSTRYDSKRYDFLLSGDFNRESRLHWLKSCVISNIYLDAKNQQAIVNIHLPETSESELTKNGGEKTEKYDEKNLRELIKRDIDEDLIGVRETFRMYSLPIYVKTVIKVSRIPGFDNNKRSDIAGLLSDLGLKSSLTSTQVIDESLAGIYYLINMKNYQYKKFYYQFDQLIRHLESVHEERPCHVGVIRIIDECRCIFQSLPKKDSAEVQAREIECAQKKLEIAYNEIKEMRMRAKEEMFTPNNVAFLDDVKNIFLFGHSSMILYLLKKHAEESNRKIWENDNIYVFECAGKRRFSPENCLEYNDGIYYASKIRDLGFKNVKIVPDVQFATILGKDAMDTNGKRSHSKVNGSNSVVLFGANGIDTFLFETKIADKALERIADKDIKEAIRNCLMGRQIDVSKIADCRDCVSTTINELNEKIADYNDSWGTGLKFISNPGFEEEPNEKWIISDRVDGSSKEFEKKYIVKKEKDNLHVYVKDDCNKPFDICSNHEQCLNRREISESLKRDFKEKGHPLSPHSRFEENDTKQETWYILEDLSILLKENKKIKVYKDEKPYHSINGRFLKYLKNIGFCDNKYGSDLDHCLKKELEEMLQVSEDFKIDNFKINRIKYDEWHLESDQAKFVIRDCSRIRVYESYCILGQEDIHKSIEDVLNFKLPNKRDDQEIKLNGLEALKCRLKECLNKENSENCTADVGEIEITGDDVFETSIIESSKENCKLKICRNGEMLYIYKESRGRYKLIDVIIYSQDDIPTRDDIRDIDPELFKALDKKGLQICLGAKIKKLARDWWNIDSSKLTLIKEDPILKVYKGCKPYCNLKIELVEKLAGLEVEKLYSQEDEALHNQPELLEELRKLRICDDAHIIKIDDRHWRIVPDGFEISLIEERISVYREIGAYCSLDKRFLGMLENHARPERLIGLSAELPQDRLSQGREMLKICEDWLPESISSDMLCKGLTDELIKNKIGISRSSSIKPHLQANEKEKEAEGTCDLGDKKSDGQSRCWTIDDIQKRRYKIQREKGKQEASVYRLDKGPSGHTSGHLMLAQIAKEFKIPVIIVADSFKMGRIKWKLTEQRKSEWLTTQKNLQDDIKGKDGKCSRGAKIELENYREDIIYEELISRVISENAPPIADIEELIDRTSEE
ncbi:MAG: hypothetical protein WCW68_10760 [Methanothrix sp.]